MDERGQLSLHLIPLTRKHRRILSQIAPYPLIGRLRPKILTLLQLYLGLPCVLPLTNYRFERHRAETPVLSESFIFIPRIRLLQAPSLNHNPLHLVQRDLVAGAVVELCGARTFVRTMSRAFSSVRPASS
jgi:hypothetical protein